MFGRLKLSRPKNKCVEPRASYVANATLCLGGVEKRRAALLIGVFVGVSVVLCSIIESDKLKRKLTCLRRKGGCLIDVQGKNPSTAQRTCTATAAVNMQTAPAAVAVQVRCTVPGEAKRWEEASVGGVSVILCSVFELDELKSTLTCSRRKGGFLIGIQG